MTTLLVTARPKVFMSYSYDSEDHVEWVRHLAETLELGDVHVILDQWDLLLGMDLAVFMEESVEQADFLLAICTRKYAERANSRKKGVGYEATVVTADILADRKTDTIIPVLRSGTDEESLPRFLRTKRYVDLRDSDAYTRAVADLLGRFHKKPRFTRPKQEEPEQQPTSTLAELIKLAETTPGWSKKRSYYREALQLQETTDIHRKAAWCSLHLNDFEAARQHDERAVALDPDNVYAWVGLTVAGWFLGDRALVERSFQEVQKRADLKGVFYAEAAFYYGQQLFRAGRRDEAIPHLEIEKGIRVASENNVFGDGGRIPGEECFKVIEAHQQHNAHRVSPPGLSAAGFPPDKTNTLASPQASSVLGVFASSTFVGVISVVRLKSSRKASKFRAEWSPTSPGYMM